MKNWERVLALWLMACSAVLAAGAQDRKRWEDVAPAPSERFPAAWYEGSTPTTMEAPVTGTPYSATMVTSYRLGAGGVKTTRLKWYRDSAGRTRTEEGAGSLTAPEEHGLTTGPRQVEVVDTVSHCSFRWVESLSGEPVRGPLVATVSCRPLKLTYAEGDDFAYVTAQVAADDPGPNPRGRTEPLGHKVIEGFDALGIRRVIYRRSDGKDLEPPVNVELWWSPTLKEQMWMGPVPDNEGIPRFELKDIQTGEPDAALFYPPANYRIVKEGDPVP